MSTTPAKEEIKLVPESVTALLRDGIEVNRGPSQGNAKEGKAVEIWITMVSFSSVFN